MGNGAGTNRDPSIVQAIKDDYKSHLARGISEEDIEKILRKKYDSEDDIQGRSNYAASVNLQIEEDFKKSNRESIQRRDSTQATPARRESTQTALPRRDSSQTTLSRRDTGVPARRESVQGLNLSTKSSFSGNQMSNENSSRMRRSSVQDQTMIQYDNDFTFDAEKNGDSLQPLTRTNRPDFRRAGSLPIESKCVHCNMVFLSQARLDLHNKTSEVHARNVATKSFRMAPEQIERNESLLEEKVSSEPTIAELITKANILADSESIKETISMKVSSVSSDEGILIYSGSEFFTTTRDHLDIFMFLHNYSKTLEIIAFDTYENKELNRLYLSIPVLSSLIGEELMKSVKRELWRNMGSETFVTQEVQKQSAKILAIIMQALHHIDVVYDRPKQDTISFRGSISQSGKISNSNGNVLGSQSPDHSQNSGQTITSLEKILIFKSFSEDGASCMDPIIYDPVVPKSDIPIKSKSNSISTNTSRSIGGIKRGSKHAELSDNSSLSAIETVLLSKRHVEDAINAAQSIADNPQQCGIAPPSRRRSIL